MLTGIKNRAKFNIDLPKLIGGGKPCAVMMMDIDNFKKINDTYGHNMGDEALKQIGLRLQNVSSEVMTPYRFAGDEFIVIVESGDKNVIDEYARKCMRVFEETFVFGDNSVVIHGSMGISVYEEGDNMLNLIGRADTAMYQVKKSGKNAYGYYNKEAS